MMMNQSLVWVGFCRTCLGGGTWTYVGNELLQDSGPYGRGIRGFVAPSPSVHLGCLGRSAGEEPKVGGGAEGANPNSS